MAFLRVSNSGPILFLILIEDLIRRLLAVDNISVFVYADDIKLLSGSFSKLQIALNIVENWFAIWKLKIQPTKSEVITFFRKAAANTTSMDLILKEYPQS